MIKLFDLQAQILLKSFGVYTLCSFHLQNREHSPCFSEDIENRNILKGSEALPPLPGNRSLARPKFVLVLDGGILLIFIRISNK